MHRTLSSGDALNGQTCVYVTRCGRVIVKKDSKEMAGGQGDKTAKSTKSEKLGKST